jgi:hypothetical protein
VPSGLRGSRGQTGDLYSRFRLWDTSTGLLHEINRSTPPQARDAALPGGGPTGARNIDPGNSNLLRGGYGDMKYYSNRRNAYDNGEQDTPGFNLEPRGRATPAMIWSYANGAADAAVDPQSVAAFLGASLSQMDPAERQECLAAIAEVLGQYDDSPNGNGNGNGNGQYAASAMSPNDQAAARRRNNNNRNGDRRAAMDSSLRHSGGTFHDRFPEASGIRIMG